jgi:hypothetical protein
VAEEGLVAYLKADATLTGLIADRLYPGCAPRNAAAPRVTYSRVSTFRPSVLEGHSGMPTTRLQLDVWGDTLATTRAVTRRLLTLLNGYSGAMGDEHAAASLVDDQRTDHERPEDGSDVATYRETLDVLLSYDETD